MESYKNKPNFIECKTVEEANEVDMEQYTFLKYSELRHLYIFKIREKRKA